MAYLAKIETQDSRPVALPAIAANSNTRPNFSPLEWSIIRLARIDQFARPIARAFAADAVPDAARARRRRRGRRP